MYICVLCEEKFEGETRFFLSDESEPLCKKCYDLSKKPPPGVIVVNEKKEQSKYFATDGEYFIPK